MNFKFLIVFVVIMATNAYPQQHNTDNFNFKFLKAKENKKLFEGVTRVYTIKVDRKNSKKIQLRLKIKSLSKEKEIFDPNKFYLVSERYKLRLRPIDITRNFGAGMIFYGFNRLTNAPSDDKKIQEWVDYKPEVKDSFYDFTIDNLQEISPKINIGTKRKPILIEPYYDLDSIKSCKIDVYFGVPKDLEFGKLYYGKTLIADFQL